MASCKRPAGRGQPSAIKASKDAMEGKSSDVRNAGQEPARAAKIIGTTNTPAHHVATPVFLRDKCILLGPGFELFFAFF
jgi:hypothetical protein